MSENRQLSEYEESILALKEALADMEAGDPGIPFEEFESEFRKQNGLPPATPSAPPRDS